MKGEGDIMNDTITAPTLKKGFSWKKLLCIVFSVLFVLLLTMSVKQTASATVEANDRHAIAELATITDSYGLVSSYEPASDTLNLQNATEEMGSIALPQSYGSYNVLYVHTNTDTQYLLKATYIRADRPYERYSTTGVMLDDGRHLFLLYGPIEGSVRLEVEPGATVGITAIDTVRISEYALGYAPNWISIVSLAVLLLIVILLEKKLGYFAWVRSCFEALVTTAKEVKEQGKLKLILHLLSHLAILAFIGMVLVDLAFNITNDRFALAFTIVASLAIAGLLTDTCFVTKTAKPAPLLLAVILIIGSIFALTVSPSMQISWDDGYHFANTAYVPSIVTNGGKIPLGVYEYTAEHFNDGIYQAYPNESLGALLYFSEYNSTAIDVGATMELLGSVAWYYYPLALIASPFLIVYFLFIYISYIPAIITLAIPGALGTEVMKSLVIGKLTNLLCYALLAYFAVKKLRSGKLIFSAFALLPICLFLAANYSADWWINGAMMLGLAYFISILQSKDEKASKKDLIIMIAAMALACGPKEIYFFMMIPLLFIPTDRFQDKKAARWTKFIIAALMVIILLSFLLPMLVNTSSQTDTRGGEDVSASGQIAFILKNPLTYAKILINYIKDFIALTSMSGNLALYGWLGFGHPFYMLIAIMVLFYCAFTDRTEADRFRGAGGISAISILTAIAQIVLVITALYISYTPVGHETVNGCQYRYILPVFPLVLYFFAPIAGENKMRSCTKCALVFGLLALATLGSFYGVFIKPMFL